MPLSGSLLAKHAARAAAYLEGQAPLLLLPVAAGPAIPFSHDDQHRELVATEAGAYDRVLLTVMVRTRLQIAAQFTYAGDRWTVVDCEADLMGGGAFPFRARLEAHVR